MPRQAQLTTGRDAEPVRVAAGILQDAAGRVLITERLGDSAFAGLWEFPGGKIKKDETPPAALRRELAEELGVEMDVCEHFMRVDHRYADRHVSIEFYLVTGWRLEPRGLEGQALRWAAPELLRSDEILPADTPVLDALRNRSAEFRKC
jgi:8-oxo-dGTP diphosphatase